MRGSLPLGEHVLQTSALQIGLYQQQ